MSRFWKSTLLVLAICSLAATEVHAQSVARQWNEQMLAAIRRNVPNPPAHARNLHHTAVAMYDAWAAYDATAVGYLYNEKVSPLPGNVEAARAEAISYAAYRVLRSRFGTGAGAATSLAAFDTLLTTLGYSTSTGQGAVTTGTTPAEVGKRIGQMVLNWGSQDGFSQTAYPQAYTSAVNPNMSAPLSVLGMNLNFQSNMPLGFGVPVGTDPNYWQPLDLATSITQNGIPIPGGPQSFVGVQSLATLPFSLTRSDATKPWLDPHGGPSKLGTASDAAYKDNFMDVVRKTASLNDNSTIDISPGAIGNNPLGADTGTGFPTNPVIGGTYAANNVKKGDYYRVLAEFWADGPNSETPPGHWHVLANEVADDPALIKRIGGTGPIVNNLEWDVKTYLSLSGAVHNAACAAWSLKRYYSGTRPITAIRYMCTMGQSSNSSGPSYHVQGIPLETDLVEVITSATAAPGGKHEQVWDVAQNRYIFPALESPDPSRGFNSYIGQIAVKGWPGEDPNNLPAPSIATHQTTVKWMLGRDWLPFQRKTFNTPAFPGYVSGHSSFSRSAAEVLTSITGSPYFPGGFHDHVVAANSMQIDLGPSASVDLQWASYYDAADQAGQSRRYGGIHPYEDDYHGREIGSTAGTSAYTKAVQYWSGSIQSVEIVPTVTYKSSGYAHVTWPATQRKINKLQKSTDFTTWTDVGQVYPNATTENFVDNTPTVGAVYRVVTVDPSPARAWNEELLAAIRRNVPNPPGHARNLHHVAVAMYDAWAAYSSTAMGYLYNEKVSPLPGNVEDARREAISYAAYRVLRSRFATGAGNTTSLASFDAQLTSMGYSTAIGQSAVTNGTTPAEVGKRIGQMILNWGAQDGFSQTSYPQAYTSGINPNLAYPMPVLGFIIDQNGLFVADMPLGYGIDTANVNPNFWQPLALSSSVTQNGIPIPGGTQSFVGVQSLATLPFSLTRSDSTKPWTDPFGGPSLLGTASDVAYKTNFMDVVRKTAHLNDAGTVNISPGAFGNNTLQTNPNPLDPNSGDSGTGYTINPITGQPYAANNVPRGDFARVLAEFWADGPNSETPPGHWHVLANEVADNPSFVKRIRGTGSTVNDLEWDVKTYFSLSGAVHNAACAAWSLKRYYSGTRPITAIRYMATKGQSTYPPGSPGISTDITDHYDPQGIPLETDVAEVITPATAAVGGKHEDVWDVNSGRSVKAAGYLDYLGNVHNMIGQIVVKGWPGEDPNNLPAPSIATHQTTVKWMLGKDWLPFQRKTFNTPAFPGYVSGHSTFSRSAAEVMAMITGSQYFPGGFHHHTVEANTMQIDLGPSTDIDLQWASYYDAADQAGQSRRHGGIHPYEDDFHGRYIGAQVGISAFNKAEQYWNATVPASTETVPTVTYRPNGYASVTWPAIQRKINKLQKSTDFNTWTDVGQVYPNATTESFVDTNPTIGGVYRVITVDPSPARAWNEELLAAIRRNVPNPPGHARNLHHVAVAMYDAWAAYSTSAMGYLYNEKVSPLPSNVEDARREAISYAAYRVLRSRFATGAGNTTSLASFDAQLTSMGYSTAIAQSAVTNGTTPAEVGKRIGQMILNWGAQDGFSQTSYPQAYTAAVNPNLNYPMPVLGFIIDKNGLFVADMPLGYGIDTANVNPNFWQPLALTSSVTQNGIPIPGGTQTFVGVQSLATIPFSLTRSDSTKPWTDPFGGPSLLGTASDAAYKTNFMDVVRKTAHLNDAGTLNISPGAFGNNTLQTNPNPLDPNSGDSGTGYATNPVTSQPYAANNVPRGDFARVLAEFWADGPNSETPPGHWHVLANEVADNPSFVKRIRGTGSTVNDLEWDVKTYFSLSGAVHNAACAAWSLKRYYSGTRPITAIRYMATKGQSTYPPGSPGIATDITDHYDPQGIPLETDLVEVITPATAAVGGKHEDVWDVNSGRSVKAAGYLDYLGNVHNMIGQIVVKGWPGEDPNNLPAPSIATHQTTVKWMLGKDWLPFQRKTFNTPAFPGYVSGHSTFSRSAAEVMAMITGSQYFPGGFHHHTVEANTMQIDLGPSTDIDLQWASYYDAADQAGMSRRFGGIHPYEDDFHGRYIGAQVGISAFNKAEQYWNATVPTSTEIVPTITFNSDGAAVITWPAVLGKMNRVESSTNFTTWTNAGQTFPRTSTGSLELRTPVVGATYRIVTLDPTPARLWNEQLLAAIRIDKPNPPAHARNLFHTATAMYDAWAAYDTTAIGYIHHERQTAGDVAAARKEAMSYAAYRMMRNRFQNSVNNTTIFANIDAQMATLGYDKNITTTVGNTPSALGNRIAATIIAWGLADGSNQAGGYGDPSYSNPQPAMIVLQGGLPRGYGLPFGTNPNLWQPLAFDAAFTQNGLQADLVQSYVGVTWLNTLPFAHERSSPTVPWIDPGPPSMIYTAGGTPTPEEAASDLEYKQGCLYVLEASARLNDQTLFNMSPKARGNNTLGADDGVGYTLNPYTGQPYADNFVKFGDYARVMAEFWADGPTSETPPGHWHVLFNEVADSPLTVKRIGGAGPIVDDLEWDAKGYFALSAATHDAACAVWSVKRAYQGVRPITAIRYMATKGQSSNSSLPSYHPQGLLLEDGVCELVTAESSAEGQRHENIWDMNQNTYVPGSSMIGAVVVYSWPGEPSSPATQTSAVRWMRAVDWVPYQRKTFNTPAFPGYISGHSGFSRAAAEVMTSITNNPFFPGGLGTFTAQANNYLVFEQGPTATTKLEWATYYDAADLAGNSRRWGGIHVREDDFKSRIIGSTSGKNAWTLAKKYFDGAILTESVTPAMNWSGNTVTLTSHTRRGLYYQWEYSTDLQNWIALSASTRATGSTMTISDTPPSGQKRFYRTRWITGP